MNEQETKAVLRYSEGAFPWEVSWKSGTITHSNVFETKNLAIDYAIGRFGGYREEEGVIRTNQESQEMTVDPEVEAARRPYIAVDRKDGGKIYLKQLDPHKRDYLGESMHFTRENDIVRISGSADEAFGKVVDEDAIKIQDRCAGLPEDGTPELAAMVLADMVKAGTLKDEDLTKLGKQFGLDLQLNVITGRFGTIDYPRMREFSAENLASRFKDAFENNPDHFLDILYSGQLVQRNHEIFTNDTNEHVSKIADIITNTPEEASYYVDVDAEDFYRDFLGSRYDENEFLSVKEAGSDMDVATRAFLEVAPKDLIDELHSKIEAYLYKTDMEFLSSSFDEERASANEHLKAEGFLRKDEAYLFLSEVGAKLEKVKSFKDIEMAIAPDYDYTMVVNAVPGLPYFTAKVYSHDAPRGNSIYILPESKWDVLEGWNAKTGKKEQGYEFLADAIKSNEFVENIFKSREAIRVLDYAAKSDKVAKMLSTAFHSYFSNYCDNTAEIYNDWKIEDAMYYACDHLSRIPEVQRNPKPIIAAIEKYNPGLYAPGEGKKEFMACLKEARYRAERIAKQQASAR